MKLHKVKRPAGVFVFEVELIGVDEFGTWLGARRGAGWEAPHARGVLDVDVALLVGPVNPWVGWWVDDLADRRVEIDICLSAQRVTGGWSYVDLELDPVRHQDGSIEIEDRDEFADACHGGWISLAEREIAEVAAEQMHQALSEYQAPFGEEGWDRLERLR